MTAKTTIEIPLSKVKLTKLVFYCVLFLAGGLWMIISNPQTSNPVFNNPFVKAVSAYGGVLMGILGIIFIGRKLFDNEPGLVLSEQGIIDNASTYKFGLIPWSDISQIYDRTVQASITSKQRFVTIGLENPDKYISRETNVLKRKLLQANAKNYGSPIHISTNGLKTSHKELLNLVNSYFEKYKQVD
ncbi:STM3941 family protein [Paraflavitalea sp. CAU 1676]|uniref:STM3941 family protein n=1 Tax=Paraflavitalea sp. CAU 1676 TaxID=3032598 RepID=UPI0023DAA9AB|nr:STM3941 family protein [Paraflavitalea sp. CAU 1676]MDF2188087.1 hypothetical protein [Paraflavitalea sp. CAU 1676]